MAVLVALLGWESLPGPGATAQVASAVTPLPGATPPASPPPIAAWTNVVLARPLFAQDRRPKPSAPGMPSRSGAPNALPRLAGTVRSNDTLMAIFVLAGAHSAGVATINPAATSPAGGNSAEINRSPGAPNQGGSPPDGTTPDAREKPIVVGRDGLVGDWTVVDIMDGAVTLERDGRTVTLRLSYADRPVGPHVAAPEALVLLHDKRTNPFLQP
jgi:hypothetical protein